MAKGGLVMAVAALAMFVVVNAAKGPISYSVDPKTGKQKRIYTVAHGHDWGAYEYIDDGGFVTGFTLELIAEVCAAAGIDCRTVWAPYTDCVESLAGQHSRGAEGLMDYWYDACTGWAVSVTRQAFAKFSESFLKVYMGTFYVKTSTNSFSTSNLQNYKIGFIDGWVYDEKCLAREFNTVLPTNKIVHYKTTVELKEAIEQGVVDVGFAEIGPFEPYTSAGGSTNPPLKKVGNSVSCMVRGNAMMTRKDSDFTMKWNDGFAKLVSSGRFQKLCNEAKKMHNADGKGVIECV